MVVSKNLVGSNRASARCCKTKDMAIILDTFPFRPPPSAALRHARAQGPPKFSMTSTLHSSSRGKAMSLGHGRAAKDNVVHPMPPEKVEIFKSMDEWIGGNVLPLLKPVHEAWQPQDFLPNPTSEGFLEQVNELRERIKEVPDEYLVVLVGDMITEEALPTYHAIINGTEIFHSKTGCDDTPWATWARGWSAEENRHGDLLNKYLFLSGRVDMKQIEKTTHHLIRSGMDPGIWTSPFFLAIYTSFQERATFISHANTAKLAMKHGNEKLAQICGTIAADEKRHEAAYTKIVGKLFELDPDETVMAFAYMMRRKIAMPAHLMYDGRDENLFDHFANVASRLGVYTARDYRQILEHLVATWKVEKLSGLSSEGREAQDYVCGLAERLRRLEERAIERAKKAPTIAFSWISGWEV